MRTVIPAEQLLSINLAKLEFPRPRLYESLAGKREICASSTAFCRGFFVRFIAVFVEFFGNVIPEQCLKKLFQIDA